MVVSDQKTVKEYNIKNIFNLINNAGNISRVQLSKDTKLSKATVSTLVEQLIGNGMVCEHGSGRSDTSGRKPILLEVKKDYGMVACISLMKNSYTFCLFDMRCSEIESFSADVVYHTGFMDGIIENILKRSKKINFKKLLGICFVLPASVNNSTGEIFSSVLEIEEKKNVFAECTELLQDIPVTVGNLSAAFAYAEKEFGGDKDIRNLIYVNVSEGVGAGIIADKRVFKGSKGYVGEFGHTSIDPNGLECVCGKRGCIEKMLNRSAILQKCLAKDYKEIHDALQRGDGAVLQSIKEIAENLAFGLSNLIAIFNPEKIVIGGGVEQIGDQFLEIIKQNIQIPCMNFTGACEDFPPVDVVYTELHNHAESKGIAKYYLDHIYKISIAMDQRLNML